MNTNDPTLTIRFDGQAVGEARISVAHLLRFLGHMTKALRRTGHLLRGQASSLKKGTPERSLADEVALDLVLLTHGSPAAVLGFQRRQSQGGLPGIDFGMDVLERSLLGLQQVQADDEGALPAGFDAGVLMAWRDAGVLFNQGVEHIELKLKHPLGPVTARFDSAGFVRLQRRIQGPESNIRTIEGRLLMADFKEHGTRCRIHPAAGEPVLCLFDDAQREEVLEDILHYVRVVGEAREDPATGRIASIRINDIERLEGKENEATDLLPKGTPLAPSFWQSLSLDDLARLQGLGPATDLSQLLGSWPGEADDGFEAAVSELRHADAA